MDLDGTPWEMRLTSVPTPVGEKLAMRLLNPVRLERRISELGMSPSTLASLENWLEDSTGMALVVGPTGCGKTTTLYALLHELKLRPRSIVTIEDPVEYEVEGVTQIQVNEATGLTFAEGLKSMLRLDPDYLMVGEIRDEESADTAIDAAGAGHLLLGTLHCRDAVGAVTMLRNYEVEDHKIAAALELVVAQRLVRRLCESCRERTKPGEMEADWLRRNGLQVPSHCWQSRGCEACLHTGYHGRLGVFEVWRLDEHCEQLILDHADELVLRREHLAADHPILLQDGMEKVAAGQTSLSELQTMRAGAQGFVLRGAP
ncbi:MAG: type II/IV secretion system protein [Akkermansiaceae bacterium]|nr:type II/IV secretion system protein [Akkermansiaceae bacterium]